MQLKPLHAQPTGIANKSTFESYLEVSCQMKYTPIHKSLYFLWSKMRNRLVFKQWKMNKQLVAYSSITRAFVKEFLSIKTKTEIHG
jgi:hypothetical protein